MYSSIAYIIDKGVASATVLANLGDKANKPGDISDVATISNIEGWIARADDLIDGFLRTVYSGTLPLVSPPELIKSCSAEIALYFGWESTERPHEQNPRAEKFDYWNDWLKSVAKGVVTLDLSGDGTPDSNASVITRTGKTYADRQFTPETLVRF